MLLPMAKSISEISERVDFEIIPFKGIEKIKSTANYQAEKVGRLRGGKDPSIWNPKII